MQKKLKKLKKRGLSLIALIFIIILTLSILVSLFLYLIPFIKEKVEKSKLCKAEERIFIDFSKGYTCYSKEGIVWVEVNRVNFKENLSGLIILLRKEAETESFEIKEGKKSFEIKVEGKPYLSLPKNGESLTYSISLLELPQPIAYWSFDNCTAKDELGKFNGIIYGNPLCKEGKKAKAIFLNINASYFALKKEFIEIENSELDPETNSFSIEAWIWPIQTYYYNHIPLITKIENREGWSLFLISSNMPSFTLDDGINKVIVQQGNINFKTWQHLVAVWNSETKTASLWINGNKLKSKTNLNMGSIKTQASIIIGKYYGSQLPCCKERWYAGGIDEVKIYKVALRKSQIQALAGKAKFKKPLKIGLAIEIKKGNKEIICDPIWYKIGPCEI